MKKLIAVAAQQRSIATPIGLIILMALAVAFWFSASQGLAQGTNCTVCHKRTTTLTFPCSSLDYRRHIDHGDPMRPCDVTPVSNP